MEMNTIEELKERVILIGVSVSDGDDTEESLKELKELADAGVDLDLCGHTHDGQMFPGNLVTDMMWENSYGYLKKGKMHNIVTSGLGVFGPDMRVGTKSEICRIKIKFN